MVESKKWRHFTKFCEISTLLLSVCTVDRSKGKIAKFSSLLRIYQLYLKFEYLLLTFESHGSLRTAAEGSSGSRFKFFRDLFSPLRLSDNLRRISPAATNRESWFALKWEPRELSVESADIIEIVSRSRGKFRKTAGYCNVNSSSSVLQQSSSVGAILKLVMEAVVGSLVPEIF